ncbi:MAG: VWA domain-containing protein [Oligoflexia bacterium]|nr:VWA domain-containing protein [Oligoflexia bacterium]
MLCLVLGAGALTTVTACSETGLTPIAGTTTRVGVPVTEKNTELELKIFTTVAECAGTVKPEDVPLCMPHVDRRSGQVRVAIQFRLDSDDFPFPLTQDNLRVITKGRVVQNADAMSVEIIPHDPVDTPQLYILVIDGSSSMNEAGSRGKTRMDRVREALLMPDVKNAFFPKGGVKTGVLLMSFTNGDPQPVGGELKILPDQRAYTKLVRNDLRVLSGFTHLYGAVQYASGPLLEQDEVRTFIDAYQAAPTVIVLTDGFNNEAGDDTCATNAERLGRLLVALRRSRDEAEDIRKRPTVFTVGLGRPLRPSFELPKNDSDKISALKLCGRRYKDRRIDGDLELNKIDNASLNFIAERGGGFAYVKTDRDGLADAFRAAAAQRYTWFEVRYEVDPHHLRRSFETRLRLMSYADAEASVRIYPSAWLDAPPGIREADGRVDPQSYRHTAVVLMPLLGGLLSLGFVGAVLFNSGRILFGRSRRPAAKARKGTGTGKS